MSILNTAINHLEAGQPKLAIETLSKLPAIACNTWEVCYLMARSHHALDEPDEAIMQLRIAILDQEAIVDVYILLAVLLEKSDNNTEVSLILKRIEKSFALKSLEPFARVLSHLYLSLRHLSKALNWAKNAEQHDPMNWEIINLIGSIYMDLGDYRNSLENFTRALEINPESAVIHHNLANVLQLNRSYRTALHHMERALAIDPKIAKFTSLYFYATQALDFRKAQQYRDAIVNSNLEGSQITPFPLLMCSDNGEIIRSSTEKYVAANYTTKTGMPKKINNKIRIGYLSGDFRAHATAYLMRALLKHHDKTKFEIHGYDFSHKTNDKYREDLLSSFSQYSDITNMNNSDVSTLINESNIDILVDLKGYTEGCRPGILFKRPAPIQVNYLGYPGTMGSAAIDYIIGDEVVTPLDHSPWYTEKLVQLSCCYQPNDPYRKVIAPQSRESYNLPPDKFIFANFNGHNKYTEESILLWREILYSCPNSVLWVLESGKRTNILSVFEEYRFDLSRVIPANMAEISYHLGRLQYADLCLDTFPCGGHTTCSDALFAGVPTLTQKGNYFQARVAASLMAHSNGIEFICENGTEYQEKAIFFYENQEILKTLTAGLRVKQHGAPYDIVYYTKCLEKAFQKMAYNYREGIKTHISFLPDGEINS